MAAPPSEVLTFDVIAQTLGLTNLGALRPGDMVHLERALRLSDRLDGHLTQGHIDGTAELLLRDDHRGEVRLTFRAPPALGAYLVPQGSAALDGVSLTLADVRADEFTVALIPTTLALTQLATHAPGRRYNLECDATVKTVVAVLRRLNAVPSP